MSNELEKARGELEQLLPAHLPTDARQRIAERHALLWIDTTGARENGANNVHWLQHIESIDKRGNADDWRRVPTAVELYQARCEEHRARSGKDMAPEARISLMRELAGLSDAERLAALPQGGAEPAPAAVAVVTATASKRFSDMSAEELDKEASYRWGGSFATWLPSKRREYHDALRQLDQSIKPGDVAALARAKDAANGGRPLSAVERIAAFRVAEAQKNAKA